eukprot:924681-Amphidinium_carterae.1
MWAKSLIVLFLVTSISAESLTLRGRLTACARDGNGRLAEFSVNGVSASVSSVVYVRSKFDNSTAQSAFAVASNLLQMRNACDGKGEVGRENQSAAS